MHSLRGVEQHEQHLDLTQRVAQPDAHEERPAREHAPYEHRARVPRVGHDLAPRLEHHVRGGAEREERAARRHRLAQAGEQRRHRHHDRGAVGQHRYAVPEREDSAEGRARRWGRHGSTA